VEKVVNLQSDEEWHALQWVLISQVNQAVRIQ
jgi:hypothetical protein